jgi:hypothetical protein
MEETSSPAGASPTPLRPNDSPEGAHLCASLPAETLGTAQRPGSRPAARDPRTARQLSKRDIDALLFIAAMGVVAQGQLAQKVFAGLSEVVVSRCVRRLLRLGLIEVLRWNRIGINLLKLRTPGHDFLIEEGTAEDQIFMARWPTAGGLAHRLWIVDAVLALDRISGFRTQTCWMLRRALAGTKMPVPDLLALTTNGRRIVAIEIDNANENLKKFVVPRLRELDTALQMWAPDAVAAIVILTLGARRAASLQLQLPATSAVVAVDLLPSAVGRPAVDALVRVLTHG